MNDDHLFLRLFPYFVTFMMGCLSFIVLLMAADAAWRLLFRSC